MKKPSPHDQRGETRRQKERDGRRNGSKKGGWAFNLASESLFALGSTQDARRVAYRTATGELRFLPL